MDGVDVDKLARLDESGLRKHIRGVLKKCMEDAPGRDLVANHVQHSLSHIFSRAA